jgi:hypothetical protein
MVAEGNGRDSQLTRLITSWRVLIRQNDVVIGQSQTWETCGGRLATGGLSPFAGNDRSIPRRSHISVRRRRRRLSFIQSIGASIDSFSSFGSLSLSRFRSEVFRCSRDSSKSARSIFSSLASSSTSSSQGIFRSVEGSTSSSKPPIHLDEVLRGLEPVSKVSESFRSRYRPARSSSRASLLR